MSLEDRPSATPIAQEMARLTAENAQLRQTILQQKELLRQRAEPIGTAFIDCLQGWTEMAAAGVPQARQLLINFHEAFETSKTAAAGIHIVRNRNGK